MIISIGSLKGGIGKTTTAIELAGYFSAKGKTCLVDYEMNRSALKLAREGRLPFDVIDERQSLRRGREFEHAICDSQMTNQPNEVKSLVQNCDLLIIPCTPDPMALDGLHETLDLVQAVDDANYRVLLTKVPPSPSPAGDEARKILTRAKIPLFKVSIPRYVVFEKAAGRGCLVAEVSDPYTEICAQAYTALGKEILK